MAQETWLFKNKRASALVQQGLEDARRGRLVKPKEDFSKYCKHTRLTEEVKKLEPRKERILAQERFAAEAWPEFKGGTSPSLKRRFIKTGAN